jgi:mono/diheme cytochrome c family protein
MTRAAAARAAPLAATLAIAIASAGAHAASPAQDYVLNCMGCHGTEAQGIPGKVPPLANALRRFMRTPEGRNYILRVPGAANSALSDEQLAAVLNWLAVTYDSSAALSQLAPFTSHEVAAQRHQPLLSVLATRSAVVRNLATTGLSPPSRY